MTLLWVSLAWLAGTFAGHQFAVVPWLPLGLGAAAAAVLVRRARWPGLPLLLALVAALALSAGRAEGHFRERSLDPLAGLRGNVVDLVGEVAEPPDRRDATARWLLAVREAHLDGVARSQDGLVQVYARWAPAVAQGDLVRVRGRLTAPPSDKGTWYAEYLERRGVHSVLRYPAVAVLEAGRLHPALAALRELRTGLSESLRRTLPEPHAALAEGITLGIRGAIPASVNEAFRATGTTHILAVSGHNLSVVTAILAALAGRWVSRRHGIFVAGFLGAVAGYALLSGMPVSVIRAAFMAALVLGAAVFGRQSHGVLMLALAVAIMAAWDPALLWDLGLQLSALAMAGVLMVAPSLERGLWRVVRGDRLDRASPRRPLLKAGVVALAASLGAGLGVLPVQAVNFQTVPFAAIPATVFALPVLALILPLSLATAFLGLLSPWAAALPAAATWAAVTYLLAVVDLWARVPGASLAVSLPHPEWGAGYLALLGLVAWQVARRVRPDAADLHESGDGVSAFLEALRHRAGVAALVAAVALTAGAGLAWSEAARRGGDGVTVHFLDVGQGDAALVTTDAGHRILIDGGPSPGILLNHLGRLLRPWERTIDVVILTHPQRDHFTGLVEVLRRYRVGVVIDGGRAAGGADFAEFERAIARSGARRVLATAGTTVSAGPVTLRALHPDGEAAVVFAGSANDASLVFRLESRGHRVLFPGDIEAPAEGWLLREGGDGVAATVIKLPHHGSKTSSTAGFLAAVAPRVAVVSAGPGNPFGHPAPEVLERLEGVPVVRTDLDGTLELRIDPWGARIQGSRPRP